MLVEQHVEAGIRGVTGCCGTESCKETANTLGAYNITACAQETAVGVVV